ncbi:MAG: penicillin-binding protein 2 [bacterium]|nr:penicillin-binding protein 2 [bacterium]
MKRKTQTSAPAGNSYLYALQLRAVLIMSICLTLLGIGSIRLGIVQAKYPERLQSLQCFQPRRTGVIPASRGRIYDNQMRPLADNRLVSSLFVNPSRVPEDLREPLVNGLRLYLNCDPDQTREALNDSDSTRKILTPEMSQDDINKFNSIPYSEENLEIFREVGIWNREARVYPLGPLAGPVIGFTSARDGGQVGLWGLEGSCDDVLSGRPGEYEDLRDQHGNRIPGSRHEITSPRNGTDIILTLDADVQALAESYLADGLENTGAKSGTVIITKPQTGDILALVSLPGLDPSDFSEYIENEEAMFSRATCLSFEPGSVLKIFTFAAALEEDVIQPDSTFAVGMGPLSFHGGRVPDHQYDFPVIDLRYAVVHSSNRAAGLVARNLGRDRFIPWLSTFGFGQKTGLDMPGEPAGDLKLWMERMPEIDLVDAGFGQGIAVTPLQLIQAMSAFANDGMLVPVRLIGARFDPAWGQIVDVPLSQGYRVLTPSTAETMEEFMVGVIDEGTAVQAKTDWVCAGKTGTSQQVNPEGGYFDHQFFSTFMGYGPVDDPEWIILVILDAPEYPYFGGAACGPIFKNIFNALMLRNGGNRSIPGLVEAENQVTVPEPETETDTVPAVENDPPFETLGGFVISHDPFSDSTSN